MHSSETLQALSGEAMGEGQQTDGQQQTGVVETGVIAQVHEASLGSQRITAPINIADLDDHTYNKGESDYVHRRRDTPEALAYVTWWAYQLNYN